MQGAVHHVIDRVEFILCIVLHFYRRHDMLRLPIHLTELVPIPAKAACTHVSVVSIQYILCRACPHASSYLHLPCLICSLDTSLILCHFLLLSHLDSCNATVATVDLVMLMSKLHKHLYCLQSQGMTIDRDTN